MEVYASSIYSILLTYAYFCLYLYLKEVQNGQVDSRTTRT